MWGEIVQLPLPAHGGPQHTPTLATQTSTGHATAFPPQDAHGHENITCLGYLVGGLLAVGTSAGVVHVYSDLAHVCSHDLSVLSRPGGSSNGVQALVRHGRGFIAAAGFCDVFLYDPPQSAGRRCGNAVPCRTVQCCAVLCSAVLCCAVLCCAVQCCAVQCSAVLFCSVRRFQWSATV